MPSTQLINIGLSQTVYLYAGLTSIRIWLAGNGTSAFTVKSATLSKGSASSSVKVNGHTSFQVPALGRWSDYVSTAGFTLPGNATLSSVVSGEVPIVMLPGDYDVGWDAGISDGTDTGPFNLDGLILKDDHCSSVIILDDDEDLIKAAEWSTYDDTYDGGGHGAKAATIGDYGLRFDTGVQITGAASSSAVCRVVPKSVKFTIEIETYFDNLEDAYGNGAFYFHYYPITGRAIWLKFIDGAVYYEDLIPLAGTTGKVKSGESATIQRWRFEFDGVLYGGVLRTFLDDVLLDTYSYTLRYSGGYPIGYLLAGVTVLVGGGAIGAVPVVGNLKSLKIINGAGDIKRTEVTSSETISVSDNTQIEDGDTLTNNVGSIPVVYTFRNLPTGAANEIIIGGTAAITSANIAAALNGTEGAIFTAINHSVPEKGFEWALAIGYTADDIIRNNNIVYACMSAHTAASINEPGVGADWETFWAALGSCTDWSGGVLFAASGETSFVMCNHNGFVFMCISEHTSAASNEPLSGVDWETYWRNTTFPVVIYPTTPYVSVTEHTSETVTKTTTSAGITIGDVIQTVIYTTPDPVATLPAFTSNGFCADGTAFLPAFTGAGTCTQDDFCIGRGVLPAMTCNAQSFITGILSSSTEQDKVSLLLYRNAYMQWFSPLVAIGSNDEIALMSTQFVVNCISYATDTSLYGTSEYWADARETLYRAAGDCEDGAILIASILNNLGISYTRVRIYFGTFNGIGHAWIAYKRESDDKWVFIDWVKGSTYWNTISSIDELDTYEISLSSYTTAFAYMDCYKYVALTTAIYLDSFEDVISNVDWPEATIDATVGGNATGEITAPVATIYGLTGSNVEVEYPAVVLNGYILSGSAMAGHITNPSASITGQVEQDTLLTGTITAPTYIVRGSGFAIAVVTGAIEYPKSVIAGTMESPVDLLALRVNTTNMAVSQYSAFNFNSMCAFNGQILGANADGIFTHSGDKDVDENIEAYFDLPSFNYESARQKSFRRIYLDGLTEGNLIVTAIRDGVDGESFAIEALGRLAETQYVFPMSREDRGVNLALRIANKDGADFSINSISATLVFSNTLPQGYSAIGRIKITAPEYEVTANVC